VNPSLSLSRGSSRTRRFGRQDLVVAYDERSFVIADRDSVMAVNAASGEVTGLDGGHSKPRCLAVDGGWLVVGDDNSAVTIFRDLVNVATFRLYQSPIAIVAVSATFKIVVAGFQKSIIICDLLTGQVVEFVALEFQPKRIVVSPAWGFVVVSGAFEGRNFVAVYSSSGTFVKKVEIDIEIECWHCCCSRNGFDYLLYANREGDVFVDEVFLFENDIAPVYECKAPLAKLAYSEQGSTGVAIARNGSVFFFPLSVGGPSD
jgi:hypothetical protein